MKIKTKNSKRLPSFSRRGNRRRRWGGFQGGSKGFTLIEVMVTIAIFSVLVGITAPFAFRQVTNKRVENTAKEVASTLYRLQQDAFSGNGNLSYGIFFTTNDYTTFTGTSFVSGANKETVSLDTGTTFSLFTLNSATKEIVFPSSSFRPSNWGTIVLTDTIQNYVIDINQEGLIAQYHQ